MLSVSRDDRERLARADLPRTCMCYGDWRVLSAKCGRYTGSRGGIPFIRIIVGGGRRKELHQRAKLP